ncbi:hypothetical protein B0T17DRAFT_97349 [Bombardia bombarda]|uniref:Uncharacterized protein n=1 Tax=Bombardia bombarda TaxID=252184 RepID=A0AA39XN29_9PEZI|nr:hypothetical protein B0T17DRAFT_97349 [Bombardia bombarda]
MSAPGFSRDFAAPRQAPRQSRAPLKRRLPHNGMAWDGCNNVLSRHSHDAEAVQSLKAIVPRLRDREVQIVLCNMVDNARRRAPAPAPGGPFDVVEYLLQVKDEDELANLLSETIYLELFRALIHGRDRYLARRVERGLEEQDPRTHCQLARAVDAFLAAGGWFWSDLAIFTHLDCAGALGHQATDTAASAAAGGMNTYNAGPSRAATGAATATGADTDSEFDSDEFAGVGPSSDEEGHDEDEEVAGVAADLSEMDLDNKMDDKMDVDVY